MVTDILKSLAPRIVQDLITSLAVFLASQGWITNAQQEEFIGAAFFLVMLVVNAALHLNRQMANFNKGALSATTPQKGSSQ